MCKRSCEPDIKPLKSPDGRFPESGNPTNPKTKMEQQNDHRSNKRYRARTPAHAHGKVEDKVTLTGGFYRIRTSPDSKEWGKYTKVEKNTIGTIMFPIKKT